MPRTNSLATCLFSAAAWVASVGAAPLPTDVMPAPAEVEASGAFVPVGASLQVRAARSNPRLKAALARLEQRWAARLGTTAVPARGASFTLVVDCHALGPAIPGPGEDESYTLGIETGRALLTAPTDIGALRGLETLLQLVRAGPRVATLPVVTIHDHPRFPWRGLMIDVARRWQPIEVLERNLDAMATVKLNVLHLHLTEDQGFRIESLTHPELQAQGSDGHYYTQAQIRAVIAFAADRGIRVVPEFDIPGHATSWVVSHPEIASLPGPYSVERQWGVFNPVLDPTNEATYALLADFLGEMAALFPDPFLHIGGDENNGVQWNANPRIQAYIRDHHLDGNAGLHAMFNRRIDRILASHGKRLVGWDEILNPQLPKDCVIDSWRGTEALSQTAVAGLDCILSNGFYIDLCYPAADHYATEPIPADSTLTPAEQAHILGGEATMWAEWVTPETIDSRIWPRTAAIAERLWSPRGVRDVPEMYRRLAIVSGRLTEAGALHERNRDLMLRHLVGANLTIPGIDSLRTLVALVEPVKRYQRGAQQIWSNQLVPLVGLADAAQPESTSAREFAGLVDRTLFAAGPIDPAGTAAIAGQFEGWTKVAEDVTALARVYPAVREAVVPAADLTEASAVGHEAVSDLAAGMALPAGRLAADLLTLDRVGQPNESATELPVLVPIRLLVAAAAELAKRPEMTPAAWHELVLATAFPHGLPAP